MSIIQQIDAEIETLTQQKSAIDTRLSMLEHTKAYLNGRPGTEPTLVNPVATPGQPPSPAPPAPVLDRQGRRRGWSRTERPLPSNRKMAHIWIANAKLILGTSGKKMSASEIAKDLQDIDPELKSCKTRDEVTGAVRASMTGEATWRRIQKKLPFLRREDIHQGKGRKNWVFWADPDEVA